MAINKIPPPASRGTGHQSCPVCGSFSDDEVLVSGKSESSVFKEDTVVVSVKDENS